MGGGMGELFGSDALLGHVLDVGDRQGDAFVLGDRHPRTRPDEVAVAAQVSLVEQIGVGDAQFETGAMRRRRAQVVRVGDLADADADQ